MKYIKFLQKTMREFMLTLLAWGTVVAPAWAVGGIQERTSEEVSSKVVDVLADSLMPIGAVIIFVSVAWTAFKMIITAHKPNERADAMTAIPYILGGGLVLGGTFLIAGFIVGMMMRMGQ